MKRNIALLLALLLTLCGVALAETAENPYMRVAIDEAMAGISQGDGGPSARPS